MELNEETLEQILSRQREGFERRLAEVSRDFKQHVEDIRFDFKQDQETTRRHMDVLVERVETKIQLIAEGHDTLRQEIGGSREQLTDLQERVTRIEGYVAAIRDMAAKNAQETVVIRLDLETIKSDITIIRRDLKDKAEGEELAALETRVAKLEADARGR